MKKYKRKNRNLLKEPTLEMLDFFTKRTKNHISLVQKYLDKVLNSNIKNKVNNDIIEKEKINHDESKFKEPELLSYIYITWNYHLKDLGKEIILSDKEKDFQNNGTNHHIKTNKHHPEYWDKNFVSVPRNDRDSVTVGEPTDGIKMPLTYICEMVCDWMAMSEEKGTNPYDWAKKNINVRWKFNKEQVDFIYEILNIIWKNNENSN